MASALPATKEVPSVSCDVLYLGFVYVHGGAGIIPGLDKVQEAFSLLKKPKKAQKAHPLFARGFETVLTLRCSEQGLKVLSRTEDGKNMVVMDHAIHKIAFVCNQGKSVLFIAKRRIDSTVDQFKCHGFDTSSQKTAKQLAAHIVSTCNSVFRKLRRTRKQIRKRTEKEGKSAPVTNTTATPSSEEAERLKRELQAEVDAAKSYRESLQTALSELDDDDDDEDEMNSTQMLEDMDKAMRINYDEFADEFAKISLEITAIAAERKERRVLKLTDDGDAIDEVDDMTESTADIDLDGDEFEINRSASI
eukprot:m.297483 g.297483  ORF g.297483 m.297483 type:complete len:306 (-) comp20082_c0_seq1:1872-2789(-)